LIQDSIDHLLRAQWEAAIREHGSEYFLRYAGLDGKQFAKLSVAILLDNKIALVTIEKRFHFLRKWKGADPQVVRWNATAAERIRRFANRRVAAAQRYDADARTFAQANLWKGHQLRSGLVFAQQAVHYLLVFVRRFGIASQLVVT
jgi:hypothetical protein